jgi:hypothetical protein
MLPAVFVAFSWYFYHFAKTGWWLATPSPAWSNQRGFVNGIGLFKNMLSIARCFFDFGMVMLSVISLFELLKDKYLNKLAVLWMIPFFIFSFSFLPFSNPINHRYFSIVLVLMIPGVVRFLSVRKQRYTMLVVFALLLGNFQIYPGKISNGWDCTLAHQSYFHLRNEFNQYFIRHKIDKTRIGSAFPMNASFAQSDLTEDTVRFIDINGEDITKVPYVLYSNISNDFSDEQLELLMHWKVIKKNQRGLVQMFFLQNPNFTGK